MGLVKDMLNRTGPSFFPIAFISRLPFAMMVVGVLTLVVSGRGSMTLGGFNSAAVGLGAAIMGPFIGAAADRFGQRRTLLVAGFVNACALALLVWLVYSPFPDWVMLLGSLLVGASAPQTSPMSRSRVVLIITKQFPVRDRERALSGAMAYESTADELVFVFGPFLVGLFAVAFGAGAPVLIASALTLIFVWAFALHPTALPTQTVEERAASLAPARDLFRSTLIVVVVGIFGVGMFFGSMLTSLTAFLQEIGNEERAGLLYGVMGIGSAIFALAVAFFPATFTKRARWVVFALIMLCGAVLIQFTHTEATIMVALLIMGTGIGPVLVTQYSFAADRSPEGRSATVMTMLGSSIIVGQSFTSALTGWISEEFGADASFLVPLLAATVVFVSGTINWKLTPPGPQLSTHTGNLPVTPSA